MWGPGGTDLGSQPKLGPVGSNAPAVGDVENEKEEVDEGGDGGGDDEGETVPVRTLQRFVAC